MKNSHSLQHKKNFTEIYNQKVYKKVKEHKTNKQIYRPIRTPLKITIRVESGNDIFIKNQFFRIQSGPDTLISNFLPLNRY